MSLDFRHVPRDNGKPVVRTYATPTTTFSHEWGINELKRRGLESMPGFIYTDLVFFYVHYFSAIFHASILLFKYYEFHDTLFLRQIGVKNVSPL